jgi:valyl-tRNA synthetase
VEIVEKYGTDAVRFTLASMASPGTDIAFSEARTEGYRAFANKIWNAARFIFMNVERAREAGIEVDRGVLGGMPPVPDDAALEARWIAARISSVAVEVNAALAEYRFHEAANVVYQFFWGDFCDWYLEIVKLRLDFSEGADKSATRAALTTLLQTFECALRLLSPFMPFLTEELWHAVYEGEAPAKSIALTRYPVGAARLGGSIEREFALLQELIVSVRALRKDLGVEEKAVVPVRIRALEDGMAFFANLEIVQRLARVSDLEKVDAMAEGAHVRSTPQFDVQVLYEKQIDVPAERERLSKELAKLEKGLASAERQLSNAAFLDKAPAHVVEGLRRQEADTRLLVEKTRKTLEELG